MPVSPYARSQRTPPAIESFENKSFACTTCGKKERVPTFITAAW